MSFGPATSRRLVRVLDVDPDLGQGLDAPDLDAAMRVATGELEVVEPGAWRPQRGTLYGGLVFEGLIVRELTLGASVSAELMGAGDVIAPWEGEEAVPFIPSEMGWNALQPVRIAWLDAPFGAAVRRWPELGAALVHRAQRRSDRLAVTQAIAQVTRVDDRVLALFWHLAERWGRVGAAGVILPVRLTHKAIARLVGAQRPSVTTAISALERRGLVARRQDGAWVLGTPEQRAVATGTPERSPWNARRSASLIGEEVPPPHMPLDLRLAELSNTFAVQGDRSRLLLGQARELRENSTRLRRDALAARAGARRPAVRKPAP